MITEKLYELAFAYKQTRLWKSLWDTDLFAVRFSDGNTGYCSVMGAIDEHIALGVYIGEKGFHSLRTVIKGLPQTSNYPEYHDFLMSQDCLQCSFENKDDLSEDEVKAVRGYARAHNISLRGANSFPCFSKYSPNHLPWHLQEQRDADYLCEALSAAIEVSEKVQERGKEGAGLESLIDDEDTTLPLLVHQDGGYIWERVKLPPRTPVQYPTPRLINDIQAAQLKRLKKAGFWECQVMRFPEPMQDEPDQAPYFPAMLLAVSGGTEQVLPPQLSERYDEEPEDLVAKFAEIFMGIQIRPAMLYIRDERTKALLEKFCERAGIRIKMCKELPILDGAVESLMAHLNRQSPAAAEFSDVLDMLMEMDESGLEAGLPDEIRQQLTELLEQNDLPAELAGQLADELSDKLTGSKKVSKPVLWVSSRQSYIISVSIGPGCYRHIQISAADTLEILHQAIQYAFGFDDDHAYVFFMNDVLWDEENAYYMPGFQAGGLEANQEQLGRLGLNAGKKFKYLFDFGDEWIFQCKVLRVLEEETGNPMIVREKGEAPKQYPDYDEEEEDDDEYDEEEEYDDDDYDDDEEDDGE